MRFQRDRRLHRRDLGPDRGDAGSPLAHEADHILPLSVATLGYSPGTSTYLAMLMALLQLAVTWRGAAGGRASLGRIPDLARETLDACEEPVKALA